MASPAALGQKAAEIAQAKTRSFTFTDGDRIFVLNYDAFLAQPECYQGLPDIVTGELWLQACEQLSWQSEIQREQGAFAGRTMEDMWDDHLGPFFLACVMHDSDDVEDMEYYGDHKSVGLCPHCAAALGLIQ